MNKIGLCLIVKNEAHVIERCLNSARPLIDYVLIVDTGSSDETIATIENWLSLNRIEGQVLQQAWRDFASNRSQALESMRSVPVDYVLMIDADEVVEFEAGCDVTAFKARLGADLYDVPTHLGSHRYLRPQLFRNDMPYYFKAIVHEYLECHKPIVTRSVVSEFHVRAIQDSHRNQNGNKFEKDVVLLEQALQSESDEYLILRYTFYLAQTLRDLDRYAEAIVYYEKRAEMGQWIEEVFWSRYQIAVLKKRLGEDPVPLIQLFLAAHELAPWRAEALYCAARLAREQQLYQQAYILAKHGLSIPLPPESLFVESWIYQYGLLDEFAIAAYWCGKYEESVEAGKRLLWERHFPDEDEARIVENIDLAITRIAENRISQSVRT